MSEAGDDEKEHEPTQKKLDDARQRGEVVQSVDLTMAAAQAGFTFVAIAAGAWVLTRFGAEAIGYLDQPDQLAGQIFGSRPAAQIALPLRPVLATLPLFLVPAAAALVALILQRAITFAPEKLQPKLSRINPISAAKHRFGVEGLVQFAKSAVKLAVVSVMLVMFLMARVDLVLGSAALDAGLGVAALLRLMVEFLVLVTVLGLAVGALDYFWQRHQHLRRNRMSRQELIDEFRQSDGDPQMKGQRRQRAQEIATNRMLADVPTADVVIVNPTHYAIALKWDRAAGRAPVCVAKGMDEIAARIREAAALAGVAIHSDPPTARALYGDLKVGQEIRPEHYRAVAAAIRYAEKIRALARERRAR